MKTFLLFILLQASGNDYNSLIYFVIFIGCVILVFYVYNRIYNNYTPVQSKDIDIEKQIQLKNLEIEKLKLELSLKNDEQHSIAQPANQENTLRTSRNFRGLIATCIFILFIGGCVYLVEYNASTRSNTPVSTDAIPKGKVKCKWCGGVGRVGVSGDSKAQYERTGNGLGNYCFRCKGTGYVDADVSQ